MKTVFPAVSASKLLGVSSIALVLVTAARPKRASTFNMVRYRLKIIRATDFQL